MGVVFEDHADRGGAGVADNLHFNEEGYKRFAAIIRPVLIDAFAQ